MYGEWMKNINLDITPEELAKYEEDKKKNQYSTILYKKEKITIF